MGHAIRHAVDRSSVEGAEIDDAIIGAVLTAGTAGNNVGRLSSLAAGLPASVAAQTIDRQCSSGLMAIVVRTISHRCNTNTSNGYQVKKTHPSSRCLSTLICRC